MQRYILENISRIVVGAHTQCGSGKVHDYQCQQNENRDQLVETMTGIQKKLYRRIQKPAT